MMLTQSVKCKPFWTALIATCALMVLLCGLGVWQMQRLHWKTALIASFSDAERIKTAPNFEAWDVSLTQPEPVMFFGSYIPQETILVPRGDKSIVYMPFKASNGVIVMMRRGVVNLKDGETLVLANVKNNTPQRDIVSVVGVPVTRPADVPFITLDNPQAVKWSFLDWTQVKKRYEGQLLAPYIVVVLEEGDGVMNIERMPPVLRNDHLMYAIFWFVMAAVAGGLFIRFFVFTPGRK